MKKIVLLGILASVFLAGCTQPTQTQTTNLDEFAQCLTEKWAIMYGSANCPHCLAQKKMFGDSFQYVTYVECMEETERCTNLKWVPTREIGEGNYLEGKQALSTLAKETGCDLP